MNRKTDKAPLVKQFKLFLRNHRSFLLFSFLAFLFLLILNTFLWPTSDEYLYATLARSFEAAFSGILPFRDINSEHVGFIPLLSTVFNFIFNISEFPQNRILTFFFSLGIIALFYKLALHLKVEKQHRLWMLWLLLLVTGFWTFSVRLMLDIPATFGVFLIMYLLIIRARPSIMSLGLILLLITKEYYIYLISPIVVAMSLLDAFKDNSTWKKRIVTVLRYNLIAFIPVVAVIVLLVDINIFPYPRLLDSSLAALFGDIYTLFNKAIFNIIGLFINNIDAVSSASSRELLEVTQQIKESSISGEIPTGIIDSKNPVQDSNFFQKIWLVYKYNLSETDINIFILPLTAIGFSLQSKKIVTLFKKAYNSIRIDIIISLLLFLFLYFNYHQADWGHGFRITIPITISLIYFSFIAIRQLLSTTVTRKQQLWFIGLTTLSIVLYWLTIKDLTAIPGLSGTTLLGFLFSIKTYLFIGIFVVTALCIVFFQKIPASIRLLGLGCLVLTMFSMKFIPFYFTAQERETQHGYDYSLATSTPILSSLAEENNVIYANTHPYRVQYYSDDPRIQNWHIDPPIRRFQERYRKLFLGGTIDQATLLTQRNNGVRYIFIINDSKSGDSLETMQAFEEQYDFVLEVERFMINDEIKWVLYHFQDDILTDE